MKTMLRRAIACALAGWACAGVQAADLSYVATALNPNYAIGGQEVYGVVEIWGTGGGRRYAAPATEFGEPFNGLLAAPMAATEAAMVRYEAASAAWTYDPAAAPVRVVDAGGGLVAAFYSMGALQVTLGSGTDAATLATSANILDVYSYGQDHWQTLAFRSAASTGDGPIPGSTFAYGGPGGAAQHADLKAMIASDPYATGFNLASFASLPIRLTPPTVFRPVAISVGLGRNDPDLAYGIHPPGSIEFDEYLQGYRTLSVLFDGLYGVTVDAGDFATAAEYERARDWVAANIRQINFEAEVPYFLTAVSAVPELPSASMLAPGLLLLAVRARRRVS